MQPLRFILAYGLAWGVWMAPLRPATITWGNGLTSSFNLVTSWSGTLSPPGSSDIGSFGPAGTLGAVTNPTLGTNYSVGGIVYASNAVSYTFSGTGTLTLGSSGLVNNGSVTQTLSVPLQLGASAPFTNSGSGTLNISSTVATAGFTLTLNGAGSGSSTLSGVISGTGGVTKSGSGSWTLSATNTYSGTTTVSAGTLRASGNAAALGAGALSLGGGTLELAGNSGLSFGRNTTLTASTAIKIDTVSAGSGVTHTLGTFTTGAGTLSISAGSNVTANTAYGLTFGATSLSSSSFTLRVANNGSATGTVTLGALSNSSSSNGLTLDGAGTVLLNSAAGSLSSGTAVVVNQGTLRLGVANALGATGLVDVTLNGLGGATAQFDLNGVLQTLASLRFGGTGASSTSLNQLVTGIGTLTVNGGITYQSTGNPQGSLISGKLALPNSSTFAIANSSNAAVDLLVSAVTSGAGGIVKTDTGLLELSAANTYSGGTSVNGGTLRVSNSSGSGTGSGTVAVGASGTLSGTGAISGATTVNGIISPGNSAPGTLSTGAQTWAGGGRYAFDINNATGAAGTAWDQLSISGTLSISSTNATPFVIDLTSLTGSNVPGNTSNFNSSQNYSWVIASATAISGFTGDKVTVNASSFTNSFGGLFSVSQSGNTILLNYSAIPEPETWGAALGAACFLLVSLRRRRSRK